MAQLKVTKRQELGTRNVRRLREDGKIPGIIYGHAQQNVPITLDEHDLKLAIAHGERVLELNVARKTENVLIKEIQYDTFGQRILHVDLTRVALDERVEVTVPIVLRGTPVEGILQQRISDVSVRSLVTKIPEDIRAAVGEMNVGDTLRLRDLPLPEETELLDDPEAIVCSIIVMAEEPEEVPAEEAEAAPEPEVLGEAKEEPPEGESEKKGKQ